MLITNIPKLKIPPEDLEWLRSECGRLLEGCRSKAQDGTVIFRPDTGGHYDAMWTRDFCYMVEGAKNLIPPQEVAAAIDFLLSRQRDDGAIPDRVGTDGAPVYLAGPVHSPLGSEPPTDNPQLLVKAVYEYVWLHDDRPFFTERVDALWRGLESVPCDPQGAVYVDPASPHAAYGFTDTVAKTGSVFFSSLLLWEAWQLMGKLCRRVEDHDLAHDAYEHAERVQRALVQFRDEEFGVYLAATYECRQIDLWGNAYAVRIGATTSRPRRRIAELMADLYGDIALRGYVRHLVAGQYWERMLLDVPHDTYQNGGYWAVPSGWVARCLLSSPQPELAAELVRDLITEFREGGVCEWINASRRALPGYVASATLLLDAVKAEGR